jgi:hypothetical protein
VRIVSNELGFRLVETLPKGRGFNGESYRDNIVTELIQLRRQAGERYLVIHADNAHPHTAQQCRTFYAENGLRSAMDSPHSPDLAPSDFFALGYVKHHVQAVAFASSEELPAGMCEDLGQIPLATLARVFEHLIERPEWVSQKNSRYYPSAKDSLISVF